MAKDPSLTIPDSAWAPTGDYDNSDDARRRLSVTIEINATPMHLEAVAIEPRDDDEQHVYDADYDEALGLIAGDGAFPVQTTEIGGREYILFATPVGA